MKGARDGCGLEEALRLQSGEAGLVLEYELFKALARLSRLNEPLPLRVKHIDQQIVSVAEAEARSRGRGKRDRGKVRYGQARPGPRSKAWPR